MVNKLKCRTKIEKHYGKKYSMKTCKINIPKGYSVWYTGPESTKKDPFSLRSKKVLVQFSKETKNDRKKGERGKKTMMKKNTKQQKKKKVPQP